jgi:hypothetical protein
MKYPALLAFVEAGLGVGVTRAATKDFTLNIVNGNVAPDGAQRSLLKFSYNTAFATNNPDALFILFLL